MDRDCMWGGRYCYDSGIKEADKQYAKSVDDRTNAHGCDIWM